MRELTEIQCRKAVERGDFDLKEILEDVPGFDPEHPRYAALILTQSWCPQWKTMKNYLPDAEKRFSGLEIFYIEYDLVPWFEEFMAFKETAYKNREVPYVRYYREEQCIAWSNFVSLEGFLHRLNSRSLT
jgi:hypothetical protein